MEHIKVKYLANIDKLKKINVGDWIDLRTARDIQLGAGEWCNIPLGIAIQLPKGYEAIIAPRSSTFKKFHVLCANSIGVIDESYCGDNDEWQFPVFAVEATHIPMNTRICQFRIISHQPQITFEEVKQLFNSNRGGFGSTD